MTETSTPLEQPRVPLGRRIAFTAVGVSILLLLFGVPWWTITFWGTDWPPAVEVALTVLFGVLLVVQPVTMVAGHGRRHNDAAARVGDVLLGLAWIAFVWSIASIVLRLALWGVDDPMRGRVVAVTTAAVIVVISLWGFREAMRDPRVRALDVRLGRLGAGLDGLRVVMITDTHFGPFDRARWSRRVVEKVNSLAPDVLCHLGDLADGSVQVRRPQVDPLAQARAELARVYVTGNHEYFGEAQSWLDHMESLGWDALHNRHIVIERGGDRLVIAGVDDRTARGSGEPGHGADLPRALEGADADLPVFLLAHQPKQIDTAVDAGVDLQVSGHTHGGQIWPFGWLVRLDQPVVQGLSRHGERTQLYTSRGTGYWGPPFRVFAPSEITVLTLRNA